MNKFKYYFILLLAGLFIASCSKKDDDDVEIVPPRDYAVQYKVDNDSIVKYLKTNYITVTADYDVTIAKIPAGGTQTSIWDQTTYKLETRPVYSNDVNYKVYYLVLRQGTGESPTNTDNVFASYSGNLLNGTVFNSTYGLGVSLSLYAYALSPEREGMAEIMPKFKTGTKNEVAADGTVTYDNYGAGVMFLPSGLGYYDAAQTNVPAYSPLVYSFKLFDLQRMDHEYTVNASTGTRVDVGDGVPDYLEDVNGDGYLYDFRNTAKYPNPPKELIDDTDGDGIADYVDFDDDGDGYSTRLEITKPADQVGWGTLNEQPFNFGMSKYYPWNPTVDNPATPNTDETEPRGIPAVKADGTIDYTSPDRLRLHVDKNHHAIK